MKVLDYYYCIAVFFFCISECFALTCLNPNEYSGQYTWTPTSALSKNYYSVTSDSTGKHLAAVVSGGFIYTSSDFGETWLETGSQLIWRSITSDSTGKYLTAVTEDSIFTSADYGQNWGTTQAPPQQQWKAIACDSSGQHVAAGAFGGSIYFSNDFGQHWTEGEAAPSASWYSIASSSNGEKLVAVASNLPIYTSVDFGQTWQETSAPPLYWISVTSDSTGQYLAAVVYGGLIYVSKDFGENWAPTSALSTTWNSITSDSSGQFLAAVVMEGIIYTSNDYGDNWIPSPSVPVENWMSIAGDSTGQLLFGAISYGTIYSGCFQSFPSSFPTMQPSARPTLQPSSSPTSYPTLHPESVVSVNAVSVVNHNGYLQSVTNIEQIGINGSERIYFSADFLQTGFGSSTFTVSISVNGFPVCSSCSVNNECGNEYTLCCYNQDITYSLTNNLGGSITITSLSSVPYNTPLCGSSSSPYFNVNYLISKGAPLPTASPTKPPSNTSALQLTLSKVIGVMIMVALAMAVFSVIIYYSRKEEKQLHSFSMGYISFQLVIFACTFTSQILFLVVLFDDQYDPNYGIAWISIRCFSIFVSFLCILHLLKNSFYQNLFHWDFTIKKKKIYRILILFSFFQPMLVQFFPWLKSNVTEVTMGFPSYSLYYLCTAATVLESFILTSINITFAIAENDLFHQSSEQQLLFYLSTIFTIVVGVISFLEMFLTNSIQKMRESYSTEMFNSIGEAPKSYISIEDPLLTGQSDIDPEMTDQ
jgi:photosystem II stability/assembly factor-like uncharacterized protein